jgi:membrane-associated phospholipid phosphatase
LRPAPDILRALIAALVVVCVVFAIWPDLDIAVARYFYRDAGFTGRSPLAQACRWAFRISPFLVIAAFVLAYARKRWSTRLELWLRNDFVGRGARHAAFGERIVAGLQRLRRVVTWAPTGREVFFLIATLTIGSGLIVNLGMKDHLHRPRPINVRQFGGPQEFRPWYRFNGACHKNCSFPSGEASSAFWMVAPALVVPPPIRAPALAAALAFGVSASTLRMAFGGHFLSDVLIGALISLIVVFAVRRALWPDGGP